MISGRWMIEKPDDVVATIKITMTIGEWCELQDVIQTQQRWPMSRVSGIITSVIAQARKIYYPEEEHKEDQ